MERIPDPIELMTQGTDDLSSRYVDECTCMQCGKKIDYDLICPSPTGDGPAVCIECYGFDLFEHEDMKRGKS